MTDGWSPAIAFGDKTSLVIKVTTRSGLGQKQPTGAQIDLQGAATRRRESLSPALLHLLHPRPDQLALQPKHDCLVPLVDGDAQHRGPGTRSFTHGIAHAKAIATEKD
jgi:hypothetical protein